MIPANILHSDKIFLVASRSVRPNCDYIARRGLLRALALLALLVSLVARAGGLTLENPRINGRAERLVEVTPGSSVELCFSESQYSYSGNKTTAEYAILVIVPTMGKDAILHAPDEQVLLMALRSRYPAQAELFLNRCTRFLAPDMPRQYTLYFAQEPLFSDELGVPVSGPYASSLAQLIPETRFVVRQHIARASTYAMMPLVHLRVTSSPDTIPMVDTYLLLNDKIPASIAKISPGIANEPVRFSWYTKPSTPDAQFRFRLYPTETEWSPWSNRVDWQLTYVPAGTHIFQVETQLPKGDGFVKLPVAYYQFFLETPFIGLSKGSSGRVTVPSERWKNLNSLYPHSKALLLGVTSFSAPGLPKLEWISNDIQKMTGVLESLKFSVSAPSGNMTREVITSRIREFVASGTEDDRMILYISTHGFQNKDDSTSGFLAGTDCEPSRAWETCLEINQLRQMIMPVVERKKIRQFLIILDACASGIGALALTKGEPTEQLDLAVHPGVHIMTAGSAEQPAYPDSDGKMSLFTRYLVEGLNGKADLVPDGYISLTELLVYVRHSVAEATDARQTPALGVLKGRGEMVFQIKSSTP